jgi:endonuclease-3
MRRTLSSILDPLNMATHKRSATASISRSRPIRSKRATNAKEKSPPSSRGLELEIGHAPEPFYPQATPPATPLSKGIKIESSTTVSTAKTEQVVNEATESPSKMSPAKLKAMESLGSSPFPDFAHPTHEECQVVNAALVKTHGKRIRPKEMNPASLGANCGEVPSVLDALVRTILSQNTNNKNSSTAKHSLDQTFGLGNYEAVREASLEDVVEALRCGGLANIKGARIKRILDEVHDKYGKLSLDHLHGASDEEAKRELMEFDGVGPKTASCVLLFCLRRDSFAVDTHVV